tara:strand:- start:271 stop:2169 length:1899 start_codon:yes stop_codon:yes gene_type:complete
MDREARSKISIIAVGFIFLILSVVLVFGASVVFEDGGTVVKDFAEDVSTNINISFNSTSESNITEINISLYGNFNFLYDSNVTNLSVTTSEVVFINTSNLLSFSNETGLIGNNTNESEISFNVTGATPGMYNISVRTVNSTGYTEVNLTINVTDSTSPNVTFNNLSNQGNYSGTIVTNILILDNFLNGLGVADYAGFVYLNITNATILDNMNETKIYNVTNISGDYYNVTIYTNNYSDGLYNITVLANDSTGNANNSEYITVRFDNTVPSEINLSSTHISMANYSGTITMNFTIVDVTSGGGGVSVNFTNDSNGTLFVGSVHNSGKDFSIDIDTTSIADGVYNVTIYANDSAGNLNTTTNVLQDVRIDNTAPTGSISCTPNPITAGGTATCACSTADEDGGSGINSNQTSFTASPVTSNTGSLTQTCNFADLAGNTGSASTSLVVNLGGGGGGGSGGGGSSENFYTKTVPIVSEDFTKLETITQQLKPKERIKIRLGESEEGKNDGEEHYIGVRSVTLVSAVVEIASDPVRIDLDIGEEAKVDLTGDGFYDVYVKLNKIENGRADLTIRSIKEEVPEEELEEGDVSGVDTSGDIIPIVEEESSLLWLWILIGVVVVIGAGVVVSTASKKKKK